MQYFKINKMRDCSAINLSHNSLRNALASDIFCGGKQFLLLNFQYKSEKLRLKFPYGAQPFHPRSFHTHNVSIGKVNSSSKNEKMYSKTY